MLSLLAAALFVFREFPLTDEIPSFLWQPAVSIGISVQDHETTFVTREASEQTS